MEQISNIKLIAETAWHHQGEFDFMMGLIDSIGKARCADMVKMHLTLDFDEYMSVSHPLYNTLKGMTFSRGQWQELVSLVFRYDLEWMSLVNDTASVEFAAEYQSNIFEVHSVCLNDINLLDSIRGNITPETELVLGVGGSSLYEIDFAINYIQHPNIVLMFGFQNYPTNHADINFNKIRKVMSLYPNYKYGYADHTAWDHPDNQLVSLLGTSLGMSYLEKHVTNQYGIERIDWQAAISIEQCQELFDKLSVLSACNGDGKLALNPAEKAYGHYGPMKKAACLSRPVKAGEMLHKKDIEFRRCGDESDLSQLDVLACLNDEFYYTKSMGRDAVLVKDSIARVEK